MIHKSYPLTVLFLLAITNLFGQELLLDNNTLLLNHFNLTTDGAAGELALPPTTTNYQTGIFNTALSVDTATALTYAATNNIDATVGTVEAWVKPNWLGFDGQTRVLLQYGMAGGILIFKDGGNNLRLIVNRFGANNGPEAAVGISIANWSPFDWKHVAFSWGNNELKIYVNGQLENTATFTAPLTAPTDTLFNIGNDNGNNNWDGLIDELRISDIARTEHEIAESYAQGTTLQNFSFKDTTICLYPTWRHTPDMCITTALTNTVPAQSNMFDWATSHPLIAGVNTNGEIIAVAPGTATLTATLGNVSKTVNVVVKTPNMPPEFVTTLDPVLTTPAACHKDLMKVVVINYLPTQDGVNIDQTETGPIAATTITDLKNQLMDDNIQLKHQLEERTKFRGYKDPMAEAYLGYEVIEYINVYEPIPRFKNVTQLNGTPSKLIDYWAINDRFNIQNYIDNQDVDEVWVWGYHTDDVVGWESNMSSPTTGDISNSDRDNNDMQIFSKTYMHYWFNYAGGGANLHNQGHQLEAIFEHVANLQDGNSDFFWEKFVGITGGINSGNAPLGRCGDTHRPPNTMVDYNYTDTTFVSSDIEDWEPNGGPTMLVNSNTWGNLNFNFPYSYTPTNPTEVNYYIYWMQNMPGFANQIPYGTDYLTNWWEYVGDWDNAISNSLGLYSADSTASANNPQVVITGPDLPCPNGTTTLSVGAGYTTYLWSDMSTSPFLNVTSTGTYSITVTDPNGCVHVGSRTVGVAPDVGQPVPICLSGITIPDLNSNGCVTVQATDLLDYAFDNCNTNALVESTVKIKHAGSTDMPTNDLTVCCVDIPDRISDTFNVEIWVWDAAGNSDFCTTYFVAQDSSDYCPAIDCTLPQFQTNLSSTTCLFANAGVTIDTLTSYQGCDSIITHTVTLNDVTAPTINCPTNSPLFCDVTNSCGGLGVLQISVTDDCLSPNQLLYAYTIDYDSDGTIDLSDSGSQVSSTVGGTYPYGTHLINWTVADQAGNSTTCQQEFTIKDCKNPTPVCMNGMTFSGWDNTGCMTVPATSLLNFAFDNCTSSAFVESTVMIKRAGTTNAPTPDITLCCADIPDGISEQISAELWVTDSVGNSGFCTVNFVLEDDATVDLCTNVSLNVNIVGNTSLCAGGSNVLDAGSGFATYLWSDGSTTRTISASTPGTTYSVTVSDANGSTGTSSLTVTADVNNPTVVCKPGYTIPALNTNGCTTVNALSFLENAFDDCSNTFFVEGSVKIKMAGSTDPPATSIDICCIDIPDAISQLIGLEIWVWDEAGNSAFCTTSVLVQDNADVCQIINCNSPIFQTNLMSTTCILADAGIFVDSLISSVGCDSIVTNIITYIPDNSAPVISPVSPLVYSNNTNGCQDNILLEVGVSDNGNNTSTQLRVDVNSTGIFEIVTNLGATSTPSYTFLAPNGTHHVEWTVTDDCGNTGINAYNIMVVDGTNPTPVCVNGMTVPNLGTNACVTVAASDLLTNAFDNCSSVAYVENSVKIRKVGDTTAPASNLTLCCADIPDGVSEFVNVEIWVEDEAGNSDYCVTYIGLQDNSDVCTNTGTGGNFNIGGEIATESGDLVALVDVTLAGSSANSFTTASNGIYGFNALFTNTYNIIPEKDINPLNGVTTFDLVLMSQHILGLSSLNSPYKLIASDVNNDGNLTTFDIVLARQLILFIITDFTNNNSWRFIDKNYVFANPQNPWVGGAAFPETITYANLSQDRLNADFVAVKIADVNESANVNLFTDAEDRNARAKMYLQVADAAIEQGQMHQVDFKAKDFKSVNGYQFTLDFDESAMEYMSMEEGALGISEGNFGFTFLNEGIITTSWHTAQAVDIPDDTVLFSLNFKAQKAVNLKDVLTINSRYTAAESYANNEAKNLLLTYHDSPITHTSNNFKLYQNHPNPFSTQTVIGFSLPETAKATLTIYDISGKVLKVINGAYTRGYNEISIDKSTLQNTGVLYYQLTSPTASATKKMILVE